MRSLVLLSCVVLASLFSCGDKDADKTSGKTSSSGGGASTADYSTPEKTVQALIDACKRGDKAAVGACFSKDAPGEFKALVDGSVSEDDFKGFCATFAGASVQGREGDGVKVKLAEREESLRMVQEGSAWKVRDF